MASWRLHQPWTLAYCAIWLACSIPRLFVAHVKPLFLPSNGKPCGSPESKHVGISPGSTSVKRFFFGSPLTIWGCPKEVLACWLLKCIKLKSPVVAVRLLPSGGWPMWMAHAWLLMTKQVAMSLLWLVIVAEYQLLAVATSSSWFFVA